MIKTLLKLLLSAIVYTIVFSAANALLPFSQGFKELNVSENPLNLLFLLLNAVWICFTMYFIIRHTNVGGKKLFAGLLFVMFFVQCFMTQIETLFFIDRFTALTRLDVVLIMFAGLFPLLAAVPLLLLFFGKKDVVVEKIQINIKSIMLKLGIIGIIYLCVYMLFGYFVAWQFEELRIFYSGSAEKLNFWEQVLGNSPAMFLFQIARGILFGIFVLPLIHMVNKNKAVFIISVCLVYLCTAVVLIIPNVLFPDMVRFGHLIEMTSSMLLFGIITGSILWN